MTESPEDSVQTGFEGLERVGRLTSSTLPDIETTSINMKRPVLVLALAAAALSCSFARATSMAANIPSLFQLSGKVYVQMTSIQWDGPATACTPATPTYMIDPSTVVGRAQLALVLTAKEANHRVYLVGDGVCVGGGPNGWLAESLIGIQLN